MAYRWVFSWAGKISSEKRVNARKREFINKIVNEGRTAQQPEQAGLPRRKPMKIITLTMNPVVDVNSTVRHVVAERKLRCDFPSYEPGGGGINVARAIHKLGGDAFAVYPAGGLTGELLQQLLNAEGIEHHCIPITGMTRESFTVLEKATGQQYRFSMPGPVLKEEEWQKCLSDLKTTGFTPEYLVASGSLPPGVPADFFGRVTRTAAKLGVRLIVDTSGEALRQAVEEGGIFLLKPNLPELSALAGQEIIDEKQQEEIVMDLVKSGKCRVVVASLGAAGVLFATADGTERIRSPLVPIVSKVGAGDSTVAGTVLSLARNRHLKEAVRFGVAAGAAAVMTPGSELCRREDAERLYRQMVYWN